MLFLAAGIICNVLLLFIIKAFPAFKVPVLQGIVVNYVVAGTTAICFVPVPGDILTGVEKPWFPVTLLLGALFISIFFLISLTAQRINITVASVANKMSVVIPVLIAFLVYKDEVTWRKILGIVLALWSVYLSTRQKGKGGISSAHRWLPITVFVGSGIIDALVNYAGKRLITVPGDDALFTAMGFFSAGIIGILILSYRWWRSMEVFSIRSVWGGLCLGVPNFFSIYFILKALNSGELDSSTLYSVANVFIVLLSALGGSLLFKERLNSWNILGIAMSVLAIVLMVV